MAQLDTREKLAILADAAKYDASCASSGTSKRDSRGGKGVGSTEGMGICHAYAPDGRCISLLKILLTNSCIFHCASSAQKPFCAMFGVSVSVLVSLAMRNTTVTANSRPAGLRSVACGVDARLIGAKDTAGDDSPATRE